jgi:CxxC-x17-CxxC domain-containing protein
MNNYSNNNRGSRNDSRGSDRQRFSSRNSGPSQMHDAVCGDCGGNCKVPFMPSSGKPVYCSNCFEKRGNGKGDSRRPSFSNNSNFSDKRSFSPKPTESLKPKFDMLNKKLDMIIDLLSKEDVSTEE